MQPNRHATPVWRPPSPVFRACWPAVHLLVHRCLLATALRAALRLTVRTSPATVHMRGPVVVVANHASHLDAPLLLTTLPRGLRRIAVAAAADYFFTTKLRSALMRWLVGAFPVHRELGAVRERGAPRRRAADALLHAGWSVLMFPEGTRSRDGALSELRPGAAALCVRTGTPCLPVRIEGTFGALAAGRRRLSGRRPRVEVFWGPPLSVLPGESVTAFNERIATALRPPQEAARRATSPAAEESAAAAADRRDGTPLVPSHSFAANPPEKGTS